MLSLKRLTSFAAACLVLSCEPVDRDYGEYEPEGPVSYPTPAIVATGAPSVAPCLCMPTCSGKPLLTGGASGCEPTLGGGAMGSIAMRVPGGESFMVTLSGAPAFTVSEFDNGVAASVSGGVKARNFVGPGAPLIRGDVVNLSGTDSVIRFEPTASPSEVNLPSAAAVVGHRLTIKVVAAGGNVVIIKAMFNPSPLMPDDIDGEPLFVMPPGNAVVTVEAHGDMDGIGTDKPGWIVIGR